MARRLYRSRRDRILGGVAGGIAEYFDLDPSLVRLAWVLVALAAGSGVLAYIAAWIIIPEEPEPESSARGSNGGARGSPGASGSGRNSPAGTTEAGGRGEGAGAGADRRDQAFWLLGLVLVGTGLALLARNFIGWLWAVPFWPLVLVIAGVILLAGALRHGPRRGEDR